MIYVITYADEKYKATQNYCEYTAYKYGANTVYKFDKFDIDKNFMNNNNAILDLPKGGGYWLWKPYFINKVMNECNEGDWIIYTDSALYFNRNLKEHLDAYIRQNKKFIVQETRFLEKQFTKADVLEALDCNDSKYINSKQIAATVIVMQNCQESKEIVAEWLKYSQNKKLITDEIIIPNCKEFIENRHDQSLLSLICKKRMVTVDNNLFRDIVFPFHSKALLTYHHSLYDKKYKMFIASLVRVLKYIS